MHLYKTLQTLHPGWVAKTIVFSCHKLSPGNYEPFMTSQTIKNKTDIINICTLHSLHMSTDFKTGIAELYLIDSSNDKLKE